MCGENRNGIWQPTKRIGSPPRVRGKQPFGIFKVKVRGITPACAGKTYKFHIIRFLVQDHPRVCGENHRMFSFIPLMEGSPPRVRGKQQRKCKDSLEMGITPACAGKTRFLYIAILGLEDHPRVCGENEIKRANTGSHVGSPPRVRGKPRASLSRYSFPGITPACAGKTIAIFGLELSPEDHPRVCGENPVGCIYQPGQGGSPPRVRGKPSVNRANYLAPRITPACAGKTIGQRVGGPKK